MASVPGKHDNDLPPLLREQGPRGSALKRVLLLLGASLCFAGGTIGWLLPVVPGFPFYLAAVVLLSMASRRVRHVINRLESSLPAQQRLGLRRAMAKLPVVALREMVNFPSSWGPR